MERILSNAQMRLADEYTIKNLGVSSEELVNRAGVAVANVIKKRCLGGRVLICIGRGNNGNDGRVIAETLSKIHGFTVNTVNVYNGIFKAFDHKYDIIVDCIFGTGLNREVEGKYKEAIERINNSGSYVVACDIASGLNGDNGKIMGCCVKANLTVAIQELKLGHFLNDGPDYSGEVIPVDIGISIWGEDYVKRITKFQAKQVFGFRNRNVNKGNFNKTCIFGGSKLYPGSVLLSSNAISALKMGVGYCNIAVASSLIPNYISKVPECTFTPFIDENGSIMYDIKSLESLMKYNSIAVGVGLGLSKQIYDCISYLITNYKGTLIIDADGLNCLSEYGLEILGNKTCKVVLTPHVGEFSRLTGISKEQILSNPIEVSKDFAKKFSVVLLLKNATSVITDGNEVYLNTTGCSGMAKGGSGDALSGILAGILANCDNTMLGVCVAAYLFGISGEIAQNGLNAYSMLPSDTINCIPKAIDYILD